MTGTENTWPIASSDAVERSLAQPVVSAGSAERDPALEVTSSDTIDQRSALLSEWVHAALARFEMPLLRYAARLIGDADAARDVVQETFTRLCGQSPAELDGRLAEWLYTVCRNRALDVRRKERRMTTIAAAALDERWAMTPAPSEAAETHETAAGVLKVLARLPGNQQEVVRLKFQDGLSYKEIAGVTGLSVSNVGFLLHTAIVSLRNELTRNSER